MKYEHAYHWTRKDKVIYGISLIPFLAAFGGAGYLLWKTSWIWLALFVSLYIITNIFQAGACTGCPYRGKYCPPVFGVYLGNYLSTVLYRNREIDMDFIAKQAKMGEVMMYLTILFPIYFLFVFSWYYPLIYGGLLVLHLAAFMPTQCEKCSYNDVCPGGIAWHKCKAVLK